ncbi:MAG: hypothetical protein ACTHKV_05230 [Flavipsychrobacter sp.]
MSRLTRLIPVMAGASLLFASCQDNGTKEQSTTTVSDTAMVKPAPQPIAITDVPASPEYKDAQLSVANVTATPQGDSVKVSFTFNVKNYELMSQTADASGKQCNNSDKGQHIHFILDNAPYAALYEPKHDVVLAKGGEHYLMAFLSRSYHESVKSKGAAVLYHFKIDDKGKLQKMEDPKTPMVFYSRPKGDYIGKANTDNVLFDFYVWNTTLSPDGYKVKADIKADGVDTTIMVTEWKSHFLKNLPMGKPGITLTLVDKDGKKVDGPNTEVTRQFNLAADEPMK